MCLKNRPTGRPVLRLALLFGLLLGSPAAAGAPALTPALKAALAQLPPALQQQETLQLDLAALGSAYGSAIQGVEADGRQQVLVILRQGQRIIYDDGQRKNPEEKLDRPDLEDMLAQPYRPGRAGLKASADEDPGRIRVEPFFNALYGNGAAEVRSNLAAVPFAGTTVSFNSRHGAAAALARVGATLSSLVQANPALRSWIFPLQGSYLRRYIAGTHRLSPHAWGIALDLHRGVYWRWTRSTDPMALLGLRAEYPGQIVAAFEEQGFIWGGKWHHIDTMHFEYRPELLAKARLAASGR